MNDESLLIIIGQLKADCFPIRSCRVDYRYMILTYTYYSEDHIVEVTMNLFSDIEYGTIKKIMANTTILYENTNQ